jgi:hypothetical protein
MHEMHLLRRLKIMQEFLQTVARDSFDWRVRVAAEDALKHWDDPLYHGREHERAVALQEAGELSAGDVARMEEWG